MTTGGAVTSSAMRSGDAVAFAPGGATVLEAASRATIVVPLGAPPAFAHFVRQGNDLILVGPDGVRILIEDYFTLAVPPTLVTEEGVVLAPELAGLAPGDDAAEPDAPPGTGDGVLGAGYESGQFPELDLQISSIFGAGSEFVSSWVGGAAIAGGGGDDLLGGGAGADGLTGGTGKDTVSYSDAASGVVVRLDLGQATNDGDGAADTLIGIEDVLGSPFNDDITGDGLDNQILADSGDDTLSGLAGNDFLFGDSGGDTLRGGAGFDVLVGGGGIDQADYQSDPAAVTVDLNSSFALDGFGGFDTLVDIENVRGSAFADTLTGDSNANVLAGGAGDDTLTGGTGLDAFFYAAVNDGFTVATNGVVGPGVGDTITDFVKAATDRISLLQSAFDPSGTLGLGFLGAGELTHIAVVYDGTTATLNAANTEFDGVSTGTRVEYDAGRDSIIVDFNGTTDNHRLIYDPNGAGAGTPCSPSSPPRAARTSRRSTTSKSSRRSDRRPGTGWRALRDSNPRPTA